MKTKNNSRTSRGFTLVELLVVITIIGILSAFIIPNMLAARDSARVAKCIANQDTVRKAHMQWVLNTGASFGASPAADEAAWLALFVGGSVPVCPVDSAAYSWQIIGTAPNTQAQPECLLGHVAPSAPTPPAP